MESPNPTKTLENKQKQGPSKLILPVYSANRTIPISYPSGYTTFPSFSTEYTSPSANYSISYTAPYLGGIGYSYSNYPPIGNTTGRDPSNTTVYPPVAEIRRVQRRQYTNEELLPMLCLWQLNKYPTKEEYEVLSNTAQLPLDKLKEWFKSRRHYYRHCAKQKLNIPLPIRLQYISRLQHLSRSPRKGLKRSRSWHGEDLTTERED